MSGRLAVFVPVVGQPSEIFLRRHVELIAPDRTVIVARRAAPPDQATWRTDLPVLWLDALSDEWGGRAEQLAVSEFLERHNVTAALLEYLDIWLPFLELFRARGLTTVARGHGYDLSMRLREPYWCDAYRSYADVDAVAVPSQHAVRRLTPIGLPSGRLHVVPNGVELPNRTWTGGEDGTVRVLAVGRLVPKKDPVATVRACAAAARGGARLHLTIAGDGPLRDDVRRAVEASFLSCDLPGVLPHTRVLELMGRGGIFCQHSVVDPQTGDEEGLPVAILEAMAHAMPVVSTRHAGIPEMVEEGTTGFLVDEGDVEAMAERLARLADDPSLRRRMGAAGRARVNDGFTVERECSALRALLRLDGDITST